MRRALPILAVAALALLAPASLAAPAPPAPGIVIRSAESGSHLSLAVGGSQLLVDGQVAEASSSGCRLSPDYGGATCELSEAGSIAIEMGPSNDKVEVLDPLPVPLTAYLGGGSDKLIGNSETDTCFPQGARRNRCIGNGGDDVCIAGSDNTDCVGGPGEDYCKTSGGSDGCWGGPGDDVCEMGDGEDGCHGEAGSDLLYGGAGTDQLYGGAGFDYCDTRPEGGRVHDCEAGPRKRSTASIVSAGDSQRTLCPCGTVTALSRSPRASR